MKKLILTYSSVRSQTLVEALKKNKSLTTLNLESNFLSGVMLRNLIDAMNTNQTIIEFRASNQRPTILGNRIEMEIAKLVEQNTNLLRLGLTLDVADARMRVAQRLKKNKDASESCFGIGPNFYFL